MKLETSRSTEVLEATLPTTSKLVPVKHRLPALLAGTVHVP